MALYDITKTTGLGAGSGLHGSDPDIVNAVKELQGLRIANLAGDSAAAKLDLAAIRAEDTILSATLIDTGAASGAGVVEDTAQFSITDIKGNGTLTFVSAIATDVFEINGVDFTVVAVETGAMTDVLVGSTDTEMGEFAVAKIDAYLASIPGSAESPAWTVTEAVGVVTVTATLEGAAGNAITISSVDSTITADNATLTGGSDTGGVQSSTDTSNKDVFLVWFDKN